ncbi:ribokinase [Gemmobacter megaterium]|uniref:Ribokinase n=1 Tax=Gemmobacter megaterium TaxID=1086013 RepID=A0A1N7M4U4_9RHOB|nr:ribokinase [Gemmobacter megaterium]GGE08918.1 ribokinase [Gemmobacter megaterium]SIS80971.1 ribokinase [Gemmobacter megaterium]
MILVFGSINVDLVARVEAIPRPGETVLAAGCATHFGGKGANQAVAAAQSGVLVQMVGAVGPDGFGQSCAENLRRRGVGTAFLQRADLATGLAFITVDQHGENAITVASGANGEVSAQNLSSAVFEDMRICVLQMEVPLAENLRAARRARAAGGRVLLNYAPAPRTIDAAQLEELLSLTDVLVMNEHETAAILAMRPRDAGTAEALAGAFGFALVRTLGDKGAEAVLPDGTHWHQPAAQIEVIDTTGAGDSFTGALAAALATGMPMPDAMAEATVAAAATCGWEGAQPPLPPTAEHSGRA